MQSAKRKVQSELHKSQISNFKSEIINQIMKDKVLKFISLTAIIGIVIGAIGGYVYYIKVGCVSGTCPITSNPYMSVLWGAAMGYLIGDMFSKRKPAGFTENKEVTPEK
jgi:hypothetical protein